MIDFAFALFTALFLFPIGTVTCLVIIWKYCDLKEGRL